MADARQDVNNSSNQSRLILAKPRLGGFSASGLGVAGSSKTSSNPFGSVLRPPQLRPANNPFSKVRNEPGDSVEEINKKSSEEVNERLNDESSDKDSVKFVPLGTSSSTPRPANPVPAPVQSASSSSQFVFGQNLSERVIVNENASLNGEASGDHKGTNGTELLFTNAAATVKEHNQNDAAPCDSTSNSGEGLAAAAAKYERDHAKPPPSTSYNPTTGEEDENNLLQISCRLFAWEDGSWRERGRGVLRLNEGGAGSRLVARVAGSLRVLLNTKVWPGMVVQTAGSKSLRITAADAQQQIKLFLIMGAPGDIAQLHRFLTSRVAASKQPDTNKQNSTSQQAAERLDEYELDQPDVEPSSDDSTELDTDINTSNEEMSKENNSETSKENNSETNEENNIETKEEKSLKRKEPVEEETSPKRQCPKIVIEQ